MPESEPQGIPQVPDDLKKLVGPFMKRSRELETAQPLISYFCQMYTVELVLKNQLHLKSPEASDFAMALLNHVESIKKEFEETSTTIFQLINDSESSFKLVLGFANKLFIKSQKEIDGHVSKLSTAQGLAAASDFYNLLNLWPEYYETEQEFVDKQRKFAKYHSVRILKAFKNKEDPNDYISPEEEEELKNLESGSLMDSDPLGLPAAPIDASEHQELMTDSDPNLLNSSLPPPPSNIDLSSPTVTPANESKTDTSHLEMLDAPKDIEGELNFPATPVIIKGEKNSLGLPPTPSIPPKPDTVTPILPPKPPATSVSKPRSTPTSRKAPISASRKASVPTTKTQTTSSHHLTKADVAQMMKTDGIISLAQKKAKFAISALNYEDIETAIKELEDALKLLRGD